MNRMPVLFVSHGAPTLALEPGEIGGKLQVIGARLATASAILMVSPHWQTRGVRVGAVAQPETIHDFGGFPEALYRLQYPAPGAPLWAKTAAGLLAESGFSVVLDEHRGLDHGAWVPLRYLRPDADWPVFQVSLPYDLDTVSAIRMGTALAPLREQGVLIIGSGSLTHNLHEVRMTQERAPYASEFAGWVRQSVLDRNEEALVDYRARAPSATRAHPSEEHFLPLLVAYGASDAMDVARHVDGGISYGVLSMDAFVWNAEGTTTG